MGDQSSRRLQQSMQAAAKLQRQRDRDQTRSRRFAAAFDRAFADLLHPARSVAHDNPDRMIQTTMNATMKTAISTVLRKAGSAIEPSVTPATNGVAEAWFHDKDKASEMKRQWAGALVLLDKANDVA